MTFEIKLLLFFIFSLISTLFMHRFFVIRAERYKIKKTNISAERWSSQTKPILGGITFYGAFLFSILVYAIFFKSELLLQREIFGVLVALTIAFMMGFADDLLNTPPGFKFIFQFLVGVILIYSGIYIQVFTANWLNYALTLFWVVGIMNSVNMLDNMDAITTSVSTTVLIGVICVLLVTKPFSGIFLLINLGVLAALISFLYYNWNPSKMYMGDNGSQFLGAFLAIMAIQVFWNGSHMPDHSNVYPFLLAFMAFIVPVSDTTTVTINRLMRGKSPFIGGRDHTTHHLSYFGLSDRKVAWLLLSINALFVALAVVIVLFPQQIVFPVWLLGIFAVLVLLVLYSITKISKPGK
ncbi:MAG: MraY family glycosyltransferase [Salinivirgaceae bacterium]|jgi:UDP-GlcNAc:undecaprenyl-phosphate GlcNAc-1-phosphate transferase|nr:MraY family glycosyltransferase [Salinivirgaceae bacterium]